MKSKRRTIKRRLTIAGAIALIALNVLIVWLRQTDQNPYLLLAAIVAALSIVAAWSIFVYLLSVNGDDQ